ncbi:kinetochore protein Nuf2-A-like [Apostichopus japonicus]|uniref:kinetochore protein Nuf2-A-like n=1 Tax=Stichopus japonicus TaxID=307972 RepID=UPI003AB5CF12
MAELMSFPLLTSSAIVQNFQELFPDQPFSEDDFKSPQPNRIQLAYTLLLEYVTGADISRIAQPQFGALQEITNIEYAENIISTLNFALALQRVMSACQAEDFKITDLSQPKPKKTRRFLSALINFACFRDCRWEGFTAIKMEIEKIQERHAGRMKTISNLKERINQIKAARAEEEARVNQMEAEVTEESQKLAANHRAKEDMQKSISQIKTSVSEKSARLEQLKVSILNSRECGHKLRTQVVQSPERMKADIARMQSALVSRKQTKVEKSQRLQELQSQAEGTATLMTSSEQSIGLITSINTLLGKQKDAISQVEQVRDQMQVQQGALTDANHREGHFCRLRESKQEKLSKLQLQHQHAVAAWQENIERNERDLEGWRQKQSKNYEQVKCFQEPMMLLQTQMADKENMHEEEMTNLKENYNRMIETLDTYHNKLAMEWNANKPQSTLPTT